MMEVLLDGSRKTKPDVEDAIRGRAVAALSGTYLARVAEPVATSDNSVGSTGDSRRVYDRIPRV